MNGAAATDMRRSPPPTSDEDCLEVPLKSDVDVLRACRHGKGMAEALGFDLIDVTRIATAISEIARNCIVHGGGGSIALELASENERTGMRVVVRDRGLGIPDLDRAMQEGYSTAGSLGIGLAAARRLMDEFELVSEVGKGTTVTMAKWKA